ncbi:MAG: FAD-binding oxidoreductase [Ardenticatenia bacterium]|nr:FAD-binding oxidoreductase [Ardenticatenia bacterium]
MMNRFRSWGGFPTATPRAVLPMAWRDAPLRLELAGGPYLPFAMGRSYGDSCLNGGGVLLDTLPLDRFIRFDPRTGLLAAEAGVTLAQILDLVVPQGWFLPVSPGTKFVSLGGAIANDVHGKNHHLAGLITWAEIQLIPIPGPQIELEARRFHGLRAFLDLSLNTDEADPYTAAWIDGMGRGSRLGRGVFLFGRHARGDGAWKGAGASPLRLPMDLPSGLIIPAAVRAFNEVYFAAQTRREKRAFADYNAFFYPLDIIHNWNRAYGRRGFLQWQCVVPHDDSGAAAEAILDRLAASRLAYFVVGKVFGDRPSPGLLSFPRPGITLAVDLPNVGERLLRLLEELDGMVVQAGGAIYPAKDARMSPATFRASFPQLERFRSHVDPAFSSSFWRRVSP